MFNNAADMKGMALDQDGIAKPMAAVGAGKNIVDNDILNCLDVYKSP